MAWWCDFCLKKNIDQFHGCQKREHMQCLGRFLFGERSGKGGDGRSNVRFFWKSKKGFWGGGMVEL